jgi:hypothetical protein
LFDFRAIDPNTALDVPNAKHQFAPVFYFCPGKLSVCKRNGPAHLGGICIDIISDVEHERTCTDVLGIVFEWFPVGVQECDLAGSHQQVQLHIEVLQMGFVENGRLTQKAGDGSSLLF